MGCTKNLTKIENHNTAIWQIFTPGRKRNLISEKGLIYPQVGVDRELRAKEEKGNSKGEQISQISILKGSNFQFVLILLATSPDL